MTRKIFIKNTAIGGGSSVKIQSMTTFKPQNEEQTIEQILRLERAGCSIVRFCITDEKDAKAIKNIKAKTNIPLVADIHFDYRLALLAVENGVDKIRINPGNIGSEKNIQAVASCAKMHKIPIRVGSNSGSIEKELLKKYGVCSTSLVESAMNNIRLLEKCSFEDIVISVKASSVALAVQSYREIAKITDYPLHLGITEAGGGVDGIIKGSMGIGSLLLDNIGDTIRVSLSDDPLVEVETAKKILQFCGKRTDFVDVISCPTCGRCNWDCMAFSKKVQQLTKNFNKPLKVSVMGCIVNGIGEAKESDIGIAGEKDKCIIFKKGEIIKKTNFENAERDFVLEIEKCLKEV